MTSEPCSACHAVDGRVLQCELAVAHTLYEPRHAADLGRQMVIWTVSRTRLEAEAEAAAQRADLA